MKFSLNGLLANKKVSFGCILPLEEGSLIGMNETVPTGYVDRRIEGGLEGTIGVQILREIKDVTQVEKLNGSIPKTHVF